MDDTVKAQVEARTTEAIEAGPYQDFREPYREHLRWLKEANPAAFSKALEYYNQTLVENIARGGDPLAEWLKYGRMMAELGGRGKVYSIDETGRALSEENAGDGNLLLHLPDDTAVRALPLAVPRALSQHQKSTLDLLVGRKLSLE